MAAAQLKAETRVHVNQGALQENGRDGGDRPVLIVVDSETRKPPCSAHRVEIVGLCRVEQRGPSAAHVVVDDPMTEVRPFVRDRAGNYSEVKR